MTPCVPAVAFSLSPVTFLQCLVASVAVVPTGRDTSCRKSKRPRIQNRRHPDCSLTGARPRGLQANTLRSGLHCVV
jgi:hypothetical protein